MPIRVFLATENTIGIKSFQREKIQNKNKGIVWPRNVKLNEVNPREINLFVPFEKTGKLIKRRLKFNVSI